jgi:cation-transporting ATPase 13A2
MEGTTIFLLSTYQYVIMAFVFSKGPPYRQSIAENFNFLFALVILTAANLWITISPLPEIETILSVIIFLFNT